MKIANFILLLLVITTNLITRKSFAQSGNPGVIIKGTVRDSVSRAPQEFLTVYLLNPENNQPLKTTYTAPDGSFSFAAVRAGKYGFLITGIGYMNVKRAIDAGTKSAGQTVDLGTILVAPAVTGLKEVTITATKPIVKQEIDRLNYDVQADPESKAFNALEMMRKVPMLAVDADDNILYKGQTDFKILINGKPSSMVERNYKDILRSMPASSIVRIEVITTPPAKYDAEGLAGIINIITQKKMDDGYNGTLNTSYRAPEGGLGVGGTFNLKLGKFGMSVSTGASEQRRPNRTFNLRRETTTATPTTLLTGGDRTNKGRSGYFNYEASYEIDSLNLLSAQFGINGDKNHGISSQYSDLYSGSLLDQSYRMASNVQFSGRGIDASANYQRGFKSNKNRLLTISYRYFNFENDGNNSFQFLEKFNLTTPDYRQTNQQRFSESTIQADLVYPVKKVNIEAGIKGIFRTNSSDFDYHNRISDTGEYVLVPAFSNNFDNRQDVFGAYNTYQYSWKKWGVKAGVRVEYTVIEADFHSTNSGVAQKYFNVIPSVSVSRSLKNNQSINLGYSQRISRPGINQLNPFVDKSVPNFEQSGNPDLRPATANEINLGVSIPRKLSLNANFGFMFFDGIIFQTTSYDSTTYISKTTYGNVGKAKLPNLNVSLNYPITKQWSANANIRIAYGMVSGFVNGTPIKNQGLMYNMMLSSGYRFTNGWRVNVNTVVNGPNLTFQGTSNSWGMWSMSVNKELYKGKLTASLVVNNPTQKFRRNYQESFGPDFFQTSNRYDYYRSVNFSLNYKFGKLKEAIKKNRRGIRNDDVQ